MAKQNNLPSHLLQVIDIFMSVTDDANLVEDEHLAAPLSWIRWDYPVTKGSPMQLHKLEKPVTTLRELVSEVQKYLKQDYDNGLCTAPHIFEDYCIELIEVHPGNMATIHFGS